ncbi:FAR1-related sequence 5-like protein [Tanacetum coccineum]|uniref:FAR1-related sequence 5-like protein n=1 Tax=Tanacetum coccineum TaxID=301880 RepID=A0ABQ5DYS1_9ASTR
MNEKDNFYPQVVESPILIPRTTKVETDCEPYMGMEFDTVDDAWHFWINYGGRMGFDVRRHWYNKNKSEGTISSMRFRLGLCRMGILLNKHVKRYTVHDLVLEHNHLLHTPETVHMMSSQRKISEVQAMEIDLADDSGIKTKASYELMSRRGGGKDTVGYTLTDQKNYIRKRRQRELKYGEAGSLLRYFQEQSLDNPSFFHAIQLDEEEQITNIFWADARMILDYSYFGDVITFDTTYSTNKECRPLGIFIGFNHHRGIVIFGASLLYDETIESFEWLFRTFLEAHNGKKPMTIYMHGCEVTSTTIHHKEMA